MNAIPLSGLARRLVKDNLLGEQDARQAHQQALSDKVPFVTHLVDSGLCNSLQIAEAASDEFGAPLFELSAFNMDMAPVDLVDMKLVQQHHALPLYRRGNRLFIAVSDPTNLRALDEIKFHTGINTDAVLVDDETLSEAIAKYVESHDEPLGGFDDLEDGLEDLDIEGVSADSNGKDQSAEIDETPIVRFVNKVLVDAIKSGASDIHFEPYEKRYPARNDTAADESRQSIGSAP